MSLDDLMKSLASFVDDLEQEQQSILAQHLEGVKALIETYMVFPQPEQSVAVTLWVVNTHVAQRMPFHYTPYLNVNSPGPRAGKSNLFNVMSLLVYDPYKVVDPTAASLYRKIHATKPTLLLDEFDAHRAPGSIRAVLNAAFEKGGKVPRGTGRGVTEYDVFTPVAIAGIGELSATVTDRSIPMNLQRITPQEAAKIKRFNRREVLVVAGPLKAKLEAWAMTTPVETLPPPPLPPDLNTRAADIWEPLLAIADLAGDHWPKTARAAALALHGEVEDDLMTANQQLLFDIKEAFGSDTRLFTRDLLARLGNIDSAWSNMGGHKLSSALKQYRIRRTQLGISGEKGWGYERRAFEDAWRRWNPPEDG